MKKNSHGRILRNEPKEQYLNTITKSCPLKIVLKIKGKTKLTFSF